MRTLPPASVLMIAAAFLSGCGGGQKAGGPATPAPSTPATTSAVAIDEPARQMCAELAKAADIQATGTSTPEGGFAVSGDEIEASSHRIKAQTYALTSRVPALQALVQADGAGAVDPRKLEGWCAENGM